MSNRIDELVSIAMTLLPRCTTCVPRDYDTTCHRCTAIHKLAAVARKSAGVPEHVALMEAVCEAAENVILNRGGHIAVHLDILAAALFDLTTYRKENGYV